jgi:hypothetical protein
MRLFLVFLMMTLSAIMPAQDRNDLPLPASGNVTMPLDEYNRLVDLARKPVEKKERPPVAYAINRADIKLRVLEDSVMGTVQCDGELFAKEITRIPLLNAPAILDARQSDKALPLEQRGGIQTAVLSGPSPFSLMLDTGIPLSIEAGRVSFDLPVPAAGSARLSLEIPGEHTNVQINPGLITSRSTADGRSMIEATVVPGRTAKVWWTTREVAAPVVPREVRFLSEVKTLISVSEADLRLTVLANITVIQGEPSQFEVGIPAGFEMTGVTGASLESEEIQSGNLVIKINSAAKRSHQFLIMMERPISGATADVPFISLKGAQRETGEILVEGEGTIELTATEGGTLKRMDVKELNAYLRSLARNPQHAAFRYHRQSGEPPSLALSWTRFPDSGVLAAAAERAVVTTVITSEGRSLTEIKLVMKNQAQPFLKVGLSPGASILTAEVAGEKVKPVLGVDGSRVPLLRPGFRPSGAYTVEFVLLHAGAPFAKKGDSELSLPRMDVPISFLQWEVFLPELYKVKDFGGDALSTSLLPAGMIDYGSDESGVMERAGAGSITGDVDLGRMRPGQVGGVVVDTTEGSLPGVEVSVLHQKTGARFSATTDRNGHWIVSNVPSGYIRITANLDGFQTRTFTDIAYKANRPKAFKLDMKVASLDMMIEVATPPQEIRLNEEREYLQEAKETAEMAERQASPNVLNLQRRVAGVLPISVDVPRAGNSYRFVRPLVLDEETTVTFRYKSK